MNKLLQVRKFLSDWLIVMAVTAVVPTAPAAVHGWLSWRGPHHTGVSYETGLPDTVATNQALWVANLPGASTPVIANGKLYIMGYLGEGANLQEGVVCFDAETGRKLWQHLFNDFLSDIIYNRYATASPAIDPETGNVYVQGTQGILAAFTAEGNHLWHRSLMESYGRLTFPNGRTATPVVDGDLVFTHGITANWGAQGPGEDRFYAFDKRTGELVWASGPGARPHDSSYSYPQLGWLGGRRVFYCTIGDGSIVCVNARTGQPLWRVPVFHAGINASVLIHNDDKAIAVFGTPYEPGEMMAVRIKDVAPDQPSADPVVIPVEQVKLWKNDISTAVSSPILVGDRIYVVAEKGDLCSVDANTGKILWKLKLGIEQRNACPLYADGKLYVPLLDDPSGKGGGDNEAGTTGAFYIIKPTDKAGQILCHIQLEGRCFGSPTAYNGKVYVQTTRKLYCFGKPGNNPGLPPPLETETRPAPGPATQLQIIPSEVALKPGETASFRVRKLDARGFTVAEVSDLSAVKWTHFIPPTAKVHSLLKGDFNAAGQLVAAPESVPSAGAFEATLDGLKGHIRGRILPSPPLHEDFEEFELTQTATNGAGATTAFAYPPLPWIGARFKFDVRERDGSKVLAKTIANKFFQRATVFIGTPDMHDYTIQADVMSDGNRRKMSEVGLINQRYYIVLKGNDQKLEINSNLERLRVPAKTDPPNFRWKPDVWYRLKARVDVAADGSGVVRAKAWPRDEPEPTAWSLEVPHRTAHRHGSPGLFGFSPQDMPVYIDNIIVTPN